MAWGSPKHEKMQKSLSSQLAVAVRSIQWSYGIFWAPSTSEERVLEWRDGYYNGDIKTRKTVQTMETKGDKIGLQRSEQLKDLSDSEWYYLVCMSFLFYPNQSLPGRALQMRETIWLCNAQNADSKVFSRSLLAKSASIQTVVCFPYLGGVIEIGTTELVSEDPNLIQHVKACFLEISKPVCSDKSSSVHNKPHDGKYPTCTKGGEDFNSWGHIKYLKELETRVEELESYMDIADSKARTRKKCPDVLEQISDNYGARKIYMGMKPRIKKRKTFDVDDIDMELERIVSKEAAKTLDLKVNMKEKEVLIEMKCPYREHILYDIMDAINNLHLDPHTVESSTIDGVLTLTLKSKFRGAATAPMGMIKEALCKVSGNI